MPEINPFYGIVIRRYGLDHKLREAWRRARRHEPPGKIAPLE